MADCVVPLSLIPLAAAAAEATFAIIGSAPALLVLAAKEELFGSCETEDDPEYRITIDRSHKVMIKDTLIIDCIKNKVNI